MRVTPNGLTLAAIAATVIVAWIGHLTQRRNIQVTLDGHRQHAAEQRDADRQEARRRERQAAYRVLAHVTSEMRAAFVRSRADAIDKLDGRREELRETLRAVEGELLLAASNEVRDRYIDVFSWAMNLSFAMADYEAERSRGNRELIKEGLAQVRQSREDAIRFCDWLLARLAYEVSGSHTDPPAEPPPMPEG